MAEEIAVGVEVKFLIPFLPRGGLREKHGPKSLIRKTSHVSDTRNVRGSEREKLLRETFSSVADVIKAVPGQDAVTSYDLKEHKEQERDCWATRWIVKKANSAEPGKDDPEKDNYVWVPVEINTPKMAWEDPSTPKSVEAVIKALRAAFYVVSNYSCEVHVHVGRMDGCPFLLPSMKRMAILLWMAEPIMRRVKDPRSPNFDHIYTWSSALREHSRLAKDIHGDNIPPVDALDNLNPSLLKYLQCKQAAYPEHQKAIACIWKATNYIELGQLMSGKTLNYRRLGFNFSAMGEEDDRARRNPKTLECRFLEGVMDEAVIISWIRAFVAMIQAGLDGVDATRRFVNTVIRLVAEADQPPFAGAFKKLMDDLGLDSKEYGPVQALIEKIHSE